MTGTVVTDVLAVPVRGGYFFDDQTAIRAGADKDGTVYRGTPLTPGFQAIREPAEAVSVMLVLSDGHVCVGDCTGVQYAGVAGREPRLAAGVLAAELRETLGPMLVGRSMVEFRSLAAEMEDACAHLSVTPVAAAYGLSQAILGAVTRATGQGLMARTIQREWGLTEALTVPPLYAQTGENRQSNVDTMIVKQVPVLPHGLVNSPRLVGPDADTLADYVRWVTRRIGEVGEPGYRPQLHFDVYGMLGRAVHGDIAEVARLLVKLEEAAEGRPLRIEHPLDAGGRDAQIDALRELRARLDRVGSRVEIVADEWANGLADIEAFCAAGAVHHVQVKTPDLGSVANSVEAILTCRRHGVGAIVGGSCVETDVSARVTTHVAMAAGATTVLAKPGMGVDEGLVVVGNEMQRVQALDSWLTARETCR